MNTDQKKHDVVVVCKGDDGAFQALGYTRTTNRPAVPEATGFGGHADVQTPFTLDFKPRKLKSE